MKKLINNLREIFDDEVHLIGVYRSPGTPRFKIFTPIVALK
jgi:hypothetical protein